MRSHFCDGFFLLQGSEHFSSLRVLQLDAFSKGGPPCDTTTKTNTSPFEPMSKRRKGFPSETKVKVGIGIVNGEKLMEEKLGRNDLCPCGSGKKDQEVLFEVGRF